MLRAPDTGSDKDVKDMYFTQKIVVSYYGIVKGNISDYVAKAVMTFLVKKSMEKIQNELLAQLYNRERFDEILFESPEIPQKRKNVIELSESLRKAVKILDEIRDIEL